MSPPNDFDLGSALYGQAGFPAGGESFDLGQHLYGAVPAAPATSKDTQNEGYLGRVGRIAGEAVSDIGAQESKPLDTSNPIATLGDISGRAVRSGLDMMNAPASIVQGGLEKGYRSVVDTMAPNAPEDLREKQARDFGEVGVGPATMALGEAGNVARTMKEGLEGLATKYVEEGHEPPPMAAPLTKADVAKNTQAQNEKFIQGVNKNLDAMKGVSDPDTGRTVGGYGEIYDKAKDTIQGVSTHAPKAQENVEELLGDMQEDPAHKTSQGSSQAYRDMQAVYDSFDENGNIPLDKVTLLKRRLNDLYSPDMGDTRGAIYARLNNQVNNIIKQARKENPEWAGLMDSGNSLFVNYKNTTDSLSRAWSLSDKKAFEDAANAKLTDSTAAPVTADIRQKIDAIAKPKDLQQYEDTMRVLPRELHKDYTQSVLDNNPTNNLISKGAKAIYKGFIGNKFGAANEAWNATLGNAAKRIDPDIAADYPHVQDAIRYHSNKADAAFNQYLDKVYSEQNPPASLALPAPSIKVPPNQSDLYRKLPAPDPNDPRFPMVNERNTTQFGKPTRGNMRPMTQEELEKHIAGQQSKSPDITTGERAAQQNRAATSEAAQKQRALEAYKNNPSNHSQVISPSDMRRPVSDYPQDVPPFLRDRFARGGAVNKQPTEAQKMAGNYKKAHVKWNGLDISIENPKGSVRTGTNKDGKEWESPPMPAHYGYIKGTIGADHDHIDCFIGENAKSRRVYIIDQKHDDGKFDEHKCILNCSDRSEAVRLYRGSFSDKKNRIMKITRLSIPEFKTWLKEGNTKHPMRKAA